MKREGGPVVHITRNDVRDQTHVTKIKPRHNNNAALKMSEKAQQ